MGVGGGGGVGGRPLEYNGGGTLPKNESGGLGIGSPPPPHSIWECMARPHSSKTERVADIAARDGSAGACLFVGLLGNIFDRGPEAKPIKTRRPRAVPGPLKTHRDKLLRPNAEALHKQINL